MVPMLKVTCKRLKPWEWCSGKYTNIREGVSPGSLQGAESKNHLVTCLLNDVHCLWNFLKVTWSLSRDAQPCPRFHDDLFKSNFKLKNGPNGVGVFWEVWGSFLDSFSLYKTSFNLLFLTLKTQSNFSKNHLFKNIHWRSFKL